MNYSYLHIFVIVQGLLYIIFSHRFNSPMVLIEVHNWDGWLVFTGKVFGANGQALSIRHCILHTISYHAHFDDCPVVAKTNSKMATMEILLSEHAKLCCAAFSFPPSHLMEVSCIDLQSWGMGIKEVSHVWAFLFFHYIIPHHRTLLAFYIPHPMYATPKKRRS